MIFLLLTRIQLSGYRSDFQGLFTSSQSLAKHVDVLNNKSLRIRGELPNQIKGE